MSIDRGMDKEDVVYIYIYLYTHMCASAYMSTKEYYSAIKKNEIRPFAATWVDLESVIQVK